MKAGDQIKVIRPSHGFQGMGKYCRVGWRGVIVSRALAGGVPGYRVRFERPEGELLAWVPERGFYSGVADGPPRLRRVSPLELLAECSE